MQAPFLSSCFTCYMLSKKILHLLCSAERRKPSPSQAGLLRWCPHCPLTVSGGPARPAGPWPSPAEPFSAAAAALPGAEPSAPLPSGTAPPRPGWSHGKCWRLQSVEWPRCTGDRAEYWRVNSLIDGLKPKKQPTQRKKHSSDCFESWCYLAVRAGLVIVLSRVVPSLPVGQIHPR